MRHIIDIETWERKDNFNFFKNFLNPTTTVTSEVECGIARRKAKDKKQSYFLHYLYAILRATNEIKEFRYRIEKDEIVLYDKVNVLTPVKLNKWGKFYTVLIPYHDNFEIFYTEAQKIIKSIPEDGNPYAVENESEEGGQHNVILVSATPNLYFTSISHTQKHQNGADFPLINVGKVVEKEGRKIMPIAISIHHGFVDGFHIAEFFSKIENILSE